MTDDRHDDPTIDTLPGEGASDSTTGPQGPGLSMGPLDTLPEPEPLHYQPPDLPRERPQTDAEGYILEHESTEYPVLSLIHI